MERRYALVEVSGGIAEVTHEDDGVDVFIFDWDNIDAGNDLEEELECLPRELRNVIRAGLR